MNVERAPLLPHDVITRALTARIVSIDRRGDLATIAQSLFGDSKITAAALNLPEYVRRAVTSPAMTTVAGWAQELSQCNRVVDILSTLAPRSTYAALSALGLRVDMSGVGIAGLPGWNTSPTGGAFVAEGAPISVRQANFSRAVLEPHKAAVIALFTSEIAGRSTPSIEAVLRAGLEAIIWAEIDSVLLGNAAASASQPAGILNGAVAVTPATGGGLGAMRADLSALVSAVSASGPVQRPTFILNTIDAVRALTWGEGLASDQITVLMSPYIAAKTVAFLDAGSFASAPGDTPEIVVSKDPTVVSRTDPVPITSTGGTRGAPETSAWQIDAFAIRLLCDLTWAVQPNRVAAVSAVSW